METGIPSILSSTSCLTKEDFEKLLVACLAIDFEIANLLNDLNILLIFFYMMVMRGRGRFIVVSLNTWCSMLFYLLYLLFSLISFAWLSWVSRLVCEICLSQLSFLLYFDQKVPFGSTNNTDSNDLKIDNQYERSSRVLTSK